MALNRPGSEKNVISEFTRNVENTMNEVVSCSVGTALLLLRDKYIDNPTDEASVADFCQRNIKELEEQAKTIENPSFKSAIEFIIRKTNEPINILDRVTLFYPSEDANSSDLRSEEYLFSLKEVLALVWTAISDNNAYLHHYAGTREERLEHAEKDFSERKDGFFNCLMRMQQKTICHHGNRNEMVFLLNGTHEDIHLLEDGKMAVLVYLKEKIAEEVRRALTTLSNDSAERKLISAAFVKWMRKSNACAVFAQIDSENKIKKGLFALFLHHGVSPQHIALDNMINEALNYLEFHCDPKMYPVHACVGELLKEIKDTKQPARSAALLQMQAWLKSNYEFNSADDVKVTHFHKIFFLHKIFIKLQDLVIVAGIMSVDDSEQYSDRLISYLDRLSTNQHTAAISIEELSDIDSLHEKLCKLELDTIHDTIENFFVHWFSENAEKPTLRRLYGLLLNNTAKKKILLTDADILNFYASRTGGNDLDITPYMINRIFLHAILVLPENWSVDFVGLLNLAFEFVENGFNQNSASDIPNQLMQDSYPVKLMRQLDYLRKKQQNAVEDSDTDMRPKKMIILPEHAKNYKDWKTILTLLPRNRVEEIVQSHLVSIRRSILDVEMLIGLINHLPNPYHSDFIIKLGFGFISSILKECMDFRYFLAEIASEARLPFINFFADKIKEYAFSSFFDLLKLLVYYNFADIRAKLIELCSDQVNIHARNKGITFNNVLGDLSYLDRIELIKAFGETIKIIFLDGIELGDCLKLLLDEHRMTLINALGDRVRAIIHDDNELIYCLGLVPVENRMTFINLFENNIWFLSVMGKRFSECLGMLASAQRIDLINKLGADIQLFIVNSAELISSFNLLDEESMPLFINYLGEKLNDIFKVGDTLASVLSSISSPLRLILINALRDKIELIGMSADRFGSVLAVLYAKDWPAFINVIGEDIIANYFCNLNQLGASLNQLSEADYVSFFIFFKTFLDKNDCVINNAAGFNGCMLNILNKEERIFFIRAFRHKAISVLNTEDDLSNCLRLLPKNEWGDLIHIIGNKFFDIFNNAKVLSRSLEKLYDNDENSVNLIFVLNYKICDIIKHPDELACTVINKELDFTLLDKICWILKENKMAKFFEMELATNSLTKFNDSVNNYIANNSYFNYLDKHIFSVFSHEIDRLRMLGADGIHKANMLMIENLKLQRIVFNAILEEIIKNKDMPVREFKIDDDIIKNKVHPVLLEKVKELTDADFIHHERNPVAAFFKKILAALLAIPLLGIPFHSKHYHRFFFETTSAKAMRKIKLDLKEPKGLAI